MFVYCPVIKLPWRMASHVPGEEMFLESEGIVLFLSFFRLFPVTLTLFPLFLSSHSSSSLSLSLSLSLYVYVVIYIGCSESSLILY